MNATKAWGRLSCNINVHICYWGLKLWRENNSVAYLAFHIRKSAVWTIHQRILDHLFSMPHAFSYQSHPFCTRFSLIFSQEVEISVIAFLAIIMFSVHATRNSNQTWCSPLEGVERYTTCMCECIWVHTCELKFGWSSSCSFCRIVVICSSIVYKVRSKIIHYIIHLSDSSSTPPPHSLHQFFLPSLTLPPSWPPCI